MSTGYLRFPEIWLNKLRFICSVRYCNNISSSLRKFLDLQIIAPVSRYPKSQMIREKNGNNVKAYKGQTLREGAVPG